MTDELVKRHIEQLRLTGGDLGDLCQPLADAIEALQAQAMRLSGMCYDLTAERDRLGAMNKATLAEIGQLYARVEALTAERDHAWAMVAKADTQVGQSLADHMQAKAERDRLRAALIEERTETLWNAYNTGMERDGRWRHMCMSDGEWLEFECGLDNNQPDHPADVVKAAIPFAAKRFVAAIVALKGETP